MKKAHPLVSIKEIFSIKLYLVYLDIDKLDLCCFIIAVEFGLLNPFFEDLNNLLESSGIVGSHSHSAFLNNDVDELNVFLLVDLICELKHQALKKFSRNRSELVEKA